MARVLSGNAGDNKIFATADKTQAYGLAGNDTLVSDGNTDVILIGGSGNDSVIIKDGNGTLSGGAGNDTFAFHYSATETLSAVIEDLNPSEDKIVVNFDGTSAPQLSSSVKGNDVVLRDGDGYLNVTLNGVRDNDYFDGYADNEIWSVLELTNDEREAQGLPALTLADGLVAGASIRAEEITNLGQTGALNDHTRPNGTPYYTVLDGKYNFPGENLDGGAEYPFEAVNDWMNSEAHKRNILDERFRKLGVGYNYFDVDESDHRWYWVQLFADGLSSTETVSTDNLLTADMEVDAALKFISLTDNPDTYTNTAFGATVDALGGGDLITNTNSAVSISGGADNDTIENSGSNIRINAGTGDDSIRLSDDAEFVLIEHAPGDGNDTVSGLNLNDFLSIQSDEYTPATVGNDIVVAVGSDSVKLVDATKTGIIILGTKTGFVIGSTDDDSINHFASDLKVSIDGGAGDDTVRNHSSNVTISGGDGNDSIVNSSRGSSVSIDSGLGDDTVRNFGSNVTISSGDGHDSIYNEGSSVSIDSGLGDDTVRNHSSNVTISSGDGNDSIHNDSRGSFVSITGGAGDDTVVNLGSNVTISGGDGNDSIGNDSRGSFVSITGGAGDDTVVNLGSNVTISGGDGNDSIVNSSRGSSVSIDSGAGDDTIDNRGSNATIIGGTGDDSISLTSDSQNNLIEYTDGDGNDTIWGFKENDTLNIWAESYSTIGSGDDKIILVGTGTITIKDGRDKPQHIVLNASGTSGGGSSSGSGGSGSGGSGSGGTSGSGGSGSGGIGDGSGVSSGISGNTSSSNSNSSGGRSSTSSSGRSVSTGTSGGNTFRRNTHSTTDNASTVTTATETTNPLTTTQPTSATQPPATTTQHVYAGGEQVISNYTSGERIVFGAQYTGAFYDGNGNFFAGSTTGALVVQNAVNKVIDLKDAAGNDFVKAYAATTAGVIDGRGLGGFEVINGSAGADAIYAGDGGSQLWGGADNLSDAMMGGNGTDIFIGGKNQGADFFLNASSTDIVHLNDATLSDIVATAEENGTIGIAFNTGNVVAVQSSEALSATVMLADGSAYRFNHENKSWIRN